MASWLTTYAGEGQAMPRGGRVQLIEGVEITGRPDTGQARWVYQQARDEHRYMAAWIADHARRFKRDLLIVRARCIAQWNALECESGRGREIV